ncbi:MAG: 4-hydroxybenzoate octaprenyltransferase [Dehalococcoidia bacterium]|nr:4-hydroxybenzoate octaprenyltransferase [Dehalococcoidia bacterium]
MTEAALQQGPLGAAWRKGKIFAESIKIEHTVFALPIAYASLFLVSKGVPGAADFGWLTLAMAGARTIAMAANRVVDARIDARNPRTVKRALPAGLLKQWEMLAFIAMALGLFLLAVYNLSERSQQLWPVALAPMLLYPYLKRFTWLCHFGISAVYVIVPPAVWIAVSGEFTAGAVLLGVGAGLWVAGFDIIYAVQDVAFDRGHGLHSIPARFGVRAALAASRLAHLAAASCIVAAGVVMDAGALYYAGAAAFVALLAWEQRLVSSGDTSRIPVAFFNMNGAISVVFGICVIGDVLVRN